MQTDAFLYHANSIHILTLKVNLILLLSLPKFYLFYNTVWSETPEMAWRTLVTLYETLQLMYISRRRLFESIRFTSKELFNSLL